MMKKKIVSVIEQINKLTMNTMDNLTARDIIEKNRKLLELIQHKAAFAYFCAENKNLALYNAFKKLCEMEDEFSESDFSESSRSSHYYFDKNNQKRKHLTPIKSDESESYQEKQPRFFIQKEINKNMTKECFKYLKKCFDNMMY